MDDQVELADDGSPLGTLKVGDTVYEPADTPAGRALVAAKELERSVSVDVTGEDDADPELIALYDGYSDKHLRSRAFERYVKDGLTVDEVAAEVGVPPRTVAAWAFNGKWNRALGRELTVRMQEEARGLAALRLRVRKAIIERQLEGSQRVRDRVLKDIDSMSAKSAAEALKAAADVEARALGMSESGSIEGASAESKKASEQTTNNTFIYMGGSLPGARAAKKEEAIDVEPLP